MTQKTIDILNKQQLSDIAKKIGIKGYYKMNKDELKKNIMYYLEVRQKNCKKSTNNSNGYKNNCSVFPKVKKLVAIGDIHGDYIVAIKALMLGGVIRTNIGLDTHINDIEWIGEDTVVVQIGDQIDRVRPSNWDNNNLCNENDSELVKDEGSDLKIFSLFENLHKKALKHGGAVLSILGNHELMNVDGDFRYVSPKEFKEFGSFFNSKKSLKKTSNLPYGFKERKCAFKPGGILAKKLALTRYSVLQVGSWVFVHGGISPELADSFTLDEINNSIKYWLLGDKSENTTKMINKLYHTSDDTFSPFWCRIYSDPEDWEVNDGRDSFHKAIKKMNIKNKRNDSNEIKGMVMGHTPQYTFGKGINSECNKKLWRIDIGASKAFGELENTNIGDELRKVQILVIENDDICKVVKEK